MRRHTAASPCRICGGYETMPRGQGLRCAGFTSDDGGWVNCSRSERAGDLPPDERTKPPTYVHRMAGSCKCGHEHGPALLAQNAHAPAPRQPTRRLVATYPYRDADGGLVYEVARTEPKSFFPRHPDPVTAVMSPGLDGVDVRVPYHLPELLAQADHGVFWVEGERDADRLAEAGLLATTTIGGAKSYRRNAAEYAEHFRGRRLVVVIPDNDADGHAYAAEVAASLVAVGAGVSMLELPGLPAKGDVTDWLNDGHSPDELRALAKAAPRWEPLAPLDADPEIHSAGTTGVPAESISLAWRTAAEVADATPEVVAWVAAPWVAAGAITELAGPPKAAGKTTFTLHMIAAVLDGREFLGRPTRRGAVVLLTEERDSTLRPALSRAGLLGRADLHILRRCDTPRMGWPDVCRAAFVKCREVGAVLFVLDTAAKWMQLRGEEENSSGAVMAAMEPIQAEPAAEIAVLMIRHERKRGGLVGEAGRGSNAWTGDVDVSLSLRRLEGNATANGRRIEALSRFDETPSALVVELTEQGYVAHGTAADIKRHAAESTIRDALPATETDALTLDEVCDATEVKRTMCAAVLAALTESGDVVRTGGGIKGSPHRYYRPEMLSASLGRELRQKETHANALTGDPEIHSAGSPSLKRREETEATGDRPGGGLAAVLAEFPGAQSIARHRPGGTVEWIQP
jgi:AAA domain